MTDSVKNKIKIIVTVVIIVAFIWFLVVFPMITFHKYEKDMESAAKRYFDLYSNELPIGERVKTVKLSTLYQKAFMKNDVFIPYTKKTCSISDSWVKVKRVNGEFKYYVYLKCGVMGSAVDHKGPEIKLYGDLEMEVDKGEKYKELGVKSVVDNSNGKLNVKDVTIKGKVNADKVGTYEVKYVALDDMNNKTTVTRVVNVVQKLGKTVQKATGKRGVYTGIDPENYIYFSNMVFRIVGINGDNVKIVADKDIANVNYDGLDEWFEYYEKHLSNKAKKLIVESKYCDMSLTETTFDTVECNHYGDNKKFGLLSVVDINKSIDSGEGTSYLTRGTITWISNSKNKKEAYANREFFVGGYDKRYMAFNKKHNFGVRPVITIKGENLIVSGNGTENKPYKLKDYVKPKKNVDLNTRLPGEYIRYSGMLWRIVDINKDGTTKVIAEESLQENEEFLTLGVPEDLEGNITYNPEQKGNVGYIINNRAGEFIDTKYFVNHEIKVPIYKGEPKYNKEIETKKYTTKISSPNMYEMFSATTDDLGIFSYWFVNSTISDYENPGMSEIGAVMYGQLSAFYEYGIRPVANFHSHVIVTSGKGVRDNPFIIDK